MRIRPFVSADLPRICQIYAASKLDELANEAFVPELDPLERDSKRFRGFLESNTFVLETQDIVAYGSHKGTEITGLYVCPSARGRGYGRVLLSHLLTQVAGAAWLHVVASNVAALNLYRQFGFRTAEVIGGSYNGSPVSVILMRQGKSDEDGRRQLNETGS